MPAVPTIGIPDMNCRMHCSSEVRLTDDSFERGVRACV